MQHTLLGYPQNGMVSAHYGCYLRASLIVHQGGGAIEDLGMSDDAGNNSGAIRLPMGEDARTRLRANGKAGMRYKTLR